MYNLNIINSKINMSWGIIHVNGVYVCIQLSTRNVVFETIFLLFKIMF